MVSTGRKNRAGGREGASRRRSGNAWDLRPTSPRGRSPLAGFDSCSLTLWTRDRIVFDALPLDRLAEGDQEDAPVGQAHLLVDLPELRFHRPLKHLEQLVDPAGFNLAVRCQCIDQVGQPARSFLRKSDAVFLAPESVPHRLLSSPSGPAWLSLVPIQ